MIERLSEINPKSNYMILLIDVYVVMSQSYFIFKTRSKASLSSGATTAFAVAAAAVSAVLESAVVSMGVAVATGCCSCNTLGLWTMRQFLRKAEHSRDIGGRADAGVSIIC